MKGYHGRFLKVDLNEQKLEDMPLNEDDAKKFIGGTTLAAKLIYDHVKPGMDPMGPENPLVFAIGPFTATSIPMVSRYTVSGISPLSGWWGEATSGGKFPFRLKGSGYDGIFITGKAKKPVYLFINEGKAEIRDAEKLWGKDSYETQTEIKGELGDKVSIACIGQAGENGVGYASIMNDEGRAAGRCGLGALMGSKNLKAVAAAGNMKTELANEDRIKELAKEVMGLIDFNIASVLFREYGTQMYMDMGMTLADVPAKYFQKSIFPAQKVSGQAMRTNYAVENYACLGCPIGCGRTIKDFSEDIESVDGPEYETVAAFGPLCMNTDLDTIIRANHLCNSYGMDTISAGVSIAYAMYLYEEGALKKKKAGMKISWGDGDVILKLIDMIAKQKGIGKILSQGTLKMAQEFGRSEDEAAQVKGVEVPMHDPRAWTGLAVSYATGPRGACHLKGDYYNVDIGAGAPVVEFDINPSPRLESEGKGANAAKYQSLKDLFDALTLCKFVTIAPTQIAQILSAITGWEVSTDDLLAAGDRSVSIKRAINNKLGLTRDQDVIPKICLEPLDEGSTAGIKPNMDVLLKEYYEYRQWDWDTGKPKKEKLLELGLEEVAKDLYA